MTPSPILLLGQFASSLQFSQPKTSMFRTILRMADEIPAKRLKMSGSGPLIGTHKYSYFPYHKTPQL